MTNAESERETTLFQRDTLFSSTLNTTWPYVFWLQRLVLSVDEGREKACVRWGHKHVNNKTLPQIAPLRSGDSALTGLNCWPEFQRGSLEFLRCSCCDQPTL